MNRGVGSREAMEDVDQSRYGLAIYFFIANEQFHTRFCARCAGLLVNEWCNDVNYAGQHQAAFLRCVQCGHRVDLMIVENLIRSTVVNHHVRHHAILEVASEAA